MKLIQLSAMLVVIASGCAETQFSSTPSSTSVQSNPPPSTSDVQTGQLPSDTSLGTEGAGGSTVTDAGGISSIGGAVDLGRCAPNAGTAATLVEVKGENWPNNTVDPGGNDWDDYKVEITGKFVVNGYEIFSSADQDIQVSYALGTPGSTTQTVSLQIVDCDHNAKVSTNVSSGNGTRTLRAAIGDRFNLYTVARTGAATRRFDLIKDKDFAYRVNIKSK